MPKNSEDKNGYVYFVKAMNGLTKIGQTNNLGHRLTELRNMSPVPLRLYHFIVTNDRYTTEMYFHEMFRQERKHGEWFLIDGDMLELVKETYNSFNVPRDCGLEFLNVVGHRRNFARKLYQEVQAKQIVLQENNLSIKISGYDLFAIDVVYFLLALADGKSASHVNWTRAGRRWPSKRSISDVSLRDIIKFLTDMGAWYKPRKKETGTLTMQPMDVIETLGLGDFVSTAKQIYGIDDNWIPVNVETSSPIVEYSCKQEIVCDILNNTEIGLEQVSSTEEDNNSDNDDEENIAQNFVINEKPIIVEIENSKPKKSKISIDDLVVTRNANDKDTMEYELALELFQHNNKISISSLQRQLRIGYSKASRFIEILRREQVM